MHSASKEVPLEVKCCAGSRLVTAEVISKEGGDWCAQGEPVCGGPLHKGQIPDGVLWQDQPRGQPGHHRRWRLWAHVLSHADPMKGDNAIDESDCLITAVCCLQPGRALCLLRQQACRLLLRVAVKAKVAMGYLDFECVYGESLLALSNILFEFRQAVCSGPMRGHIEHRLASSQRLLDCLQCWLICSYSSVRSCDTSPSDLS